MNPKNANPGFHCRESGMNSLTLSPNTYHVNHLTQNNTNISGVYDSTCSTLELSIGPLTLRQAQAIVYAMSIAAEEFMDRLVKTKEPTQNAPEDPSQ